MNGAPIIDIQDLSKTYRDGLLRRKKIEALRGVSFQVERGEIFGLLGPNGAGKTTLVKILLGIVRKSAGNATLFDRPAGDVRGRRSVGYLPENHRIPNHLTANSALEYYGGLSGLSASKVKQVRAEVLDLVRLSDWGKMPVKKYSKGMLQRLGLAQAMLHRPPLLFLDEPTDGVDPVGRSEMREILLKLKADGRTVFLNSHLLQEIELVCDRVAILDRGNLLKVGKIDEITRRPKVDVLFHVEGEESAIRAALAGEQITNWKAVDANRFQLTLQATGQPDLDGWIDALRAAGISVYSVTRRRQTLEQAFLELVKHETNGPDEPLFEDAHDKPGTKP